MGRRKHRTLLWVLALLVASASLARMLTWPEKSLRGCSDNLRHLSVALEMYATDSYGLYPRHLEALVPKYIEDLPPCPAAGCNTYGYVCDSRPDRYTVWCSGGHHPGVPRDFPATNERGLLDQQFKNQSQERP